MEAAIKIVCAGAAACELMLYDEDEFLLGKMKRRTHRFWTRKWQQERDDPNNMNTIHKLQLELLELGDVDEFCMTMRMPPHIYAELLEQLTPKISKQHTNYRPPISADVRLSITLRYLALGDSYRSLRQQYRIGYSTVGKIIREVCVEIFDLLKDIYLVTPKTHDDWKNVSKEFEEIWNFPHVLGAIDGKHIRIVCPPSSGTLFFNYKKYYSIILLAAVNAQCEFMFVDIGAEGRASDGGVWKQTGLYYHLHNVANELNFPGPEPIRGMEGDIPYYFLADDAFGMTPNLLKPYGTRGLTAKARIYNFRLSRSRMCVENAFGVLCTKFRIFRREIEMLPEGAEIIVSAACALHNMLRRNCGATYMPTAYIDREDYEHRRVDGMWRQEANLDPMKKNNQCNPLEQARVLRNKLADYFVSGEGNMTGQFEALRRN